MHTYLSHGTICSTISHYKQPKPNDPIHTTNCQTPIYQTLALCIKPFPTQLSNKTQSLKINNNKKTNSKTTPKTKNKHKKRKIINVRLV